MPRKLHSKPLTVAPLKQRLIRFLRLDKHPLPCMASKQLQQDERLRREQALQREIRGLRQTNTRLHNELLETRDIIETQQTMIEPSDDVTARRIEQARERVWRLRREWAGAKLSIRVGHSAEQARVLANRMSELAPQLAEAHDALKILEGNRDPSQHDSRIPPPEDLPPLTLKRMSLNRR